MLVSEDDGWCLSIVTPVDGMMTDVRCERGWVAVDQVAWTTEGNLALIGYPEQSREPAEPTLEEPRAVRILDPATGTDLAEGTLIDRPHPQWPLGTDMRGDGSRVHVDDGSGLARHVVVAATG